MYENLVIEELDLIGWERVIHGTDPDSGLDCYIAIHDTTLGPALGGLRMWQYESRQNALIDVMRLSEGMTYKNSLAGLDLGGGKAVINLPPSGKTPEMLRAFAQVLNYLEGTYITAEDVGCTVDDIMLVAEHSEYVSSIKGCGDPSFATAYGVVRGWQACAQFVRGRIHGSERRWPPAYYDSQSLAGVTVTIQGIGHVGACLARMAHELGMNVTVTDINKDAYLKLKEEIFVEWVDPLDVYDVENLIFAPCALGACINDDTIKRLKYDVVCGSANNQLAGPNLGFDLMARDIVYAPDYLVNAGGVTNVFREFGLTNNDFEIAIKLDAIVNRTLACLETSHNTKTPTNIIADQMAMERLEKMRNK